MYQAIILGSVLLLTFYILNRKREPKLNKPPLVRYKYPIIGHTFDYFTNNEEFLTQCRKEYGDIFSLYVFGEVKTFIGKEHAQEVLLRSDSFDLSKAFLKLLPMDAMLNHENNFTCMEKFKDYVLHRTRFYAERMQNCICPATQKYIGDCNEPKVIHNIYNVMTKIISNSHANIFIGEEESQYEEVINTFAKFTTDALKILRSPPLLNFIYPGFQNTFNRILIKLGYNPVHKHIEILLKHIKKQIHKRLQEKEKYGDSWKRPKDLLQDIMEEENFDPNNINYREISDRIGLFVYVSVHTTSNGCANTLMNLASRPEYIQELYEEQLEVRKEADENGILPFDALSKMKKLDSFVRETLRLSESVVALPHIALKDYTFSNGLQLPKDRLINIYVDDVYQDESLQGPNPKSFEPFRHVNANVSATKVSKNYIIFGGGKHACPGRHLAVNEIKFFMHNIILKYNFRTESGKIEEPKRLGPIKRPSDSGIIFESRKPI